MFLPFVILALIPIAGAFSYIAQFSVSIDPYISEFQERRVIDTARMHCAHGIRTELIEQRGDVPSSESQGQGRGSQDMVQFDTPLMWYTDDMRHICIARYFGARDIWSVGERDTVTRQSAIRGIDMLAYDIYAFQYEVVDLWEGSGLQGENEQVYPSASRHRSGSMVFLFNSSGKIEHQFMSI